MHSNFKGRYLIAALLLQTVGGSLAEAFEQSSYFVFNIVESTETEPIKGCLAVPSMALSKDTTEPPPPPQAEERSEFEIDFKRGIQPQKASTSFDFSTTPDTEPAPESTRFSTETFDFGRPTTVFGE